MNKGGGSSRYLVLMSHCDWAVVMEGGVVVKRVRVAAVMTAARAMAVVMTRWVIQRSYGILVWKEKFNS